MEPPKTNLLATPEDREDMGGGGFGEPLRRPETWFSAGNQSRAALD